MKDLHIKNLLSLATVILLLLCSTNAMATVAATYLYSFSDFTGKIPYSQPALSTDKEHDEVYVINSGAVTVFNAIGMEIYQFGDDRSLGIIADVAADKDGSVLVLSSNDDRSAFSVLRCNFRGELKDTLKLTGVPQEFSSLRPNRLVYWKKYLYLADLRSRKVVVVDSNGAFVDGYDIGAYLARAEKPGDVNEIIGFNVDQDGNMLFTVPTLFSAYRMSRDHKHEMESFGSPGSNGGKFNVVGGIASDDKGYIYVADILKSVVMVYDRDFKFQMQFGRRGNERSSLVAPCQVEVIKDKLFVNQAQNKGVSVFRMQYD